MARNSLAHVRRRLDVVAAWKGRLVIVRVGAEAVSIDARSWIVLSDDPQRHVTVAVGNRRDRFVAENVAVTNASVLS